MKKKSKEIKNISIAIKTALLRRIDLRAGGLGMSRSHYFRWLANKDLEK